MNALVGRLSGCCAIALATAGVAAVLVTSASPRAVEKYKIYVSMSYIGNDWQAEAERMISAMAQSKKYRDKVDLRIQVAGADARKQIQQIGAMVQAGAQAIVMFPISPTALNNVVKSACDHHVIVIAYDAEVTEPCAYNVHIDQSEAGRVTAEWLVKELNGQGNIVLITGVPGTSVDEQRTAGAKAVFAKSPGIKMIAEIPGMWSEAVARQKLSQLLAVRTWNEIDGIWTQGGCFTAAAIQIEAGIQTDKIKPCAGESDNGQRVMMLPTGAVDGIDKVYRPFGYRSISFGSPPYSGALALKKAVDLLEGRPVPKKIVLPLPLAKAGEVKLCTVGTWEEMKNGCNVFDPKLVPSGWLADIYGPETPEVGLRAALLGQPEE